jgi:hypothetical protein
MGDTVVAGRFRVMLRKLELGLAVLWHQWSSAAVLNQPVARTWRPPPRAMRASRMTGSLVLMFPESMPHPSLCCLFVQLLAWVGSALSYHSPVLASHQDILKRACSFHLRSNILLLTKGPSGEMSIAQACR